MGNDVTIDLKGDGDDLDRELKRSSDLVISFKTIAVASFIAIGAAAAQYVISSIAGIGPKLYEFYNEGVQAEAKLSGVIRATGGAAGYTAEQMKLLASQMRELNGVDDDAILGAMAITATFKNIRGDNFAAATQAAIDMAAVLGTDVTGAAMQVSKALNDPVKGMAALAQSGVSFTEQQKQMVAEMIANGDVMGAQKVILDELAGEFGGVAAEKANTFGGRLEALKMRLEDVGAQIFEIVLPALEALAPLVEGGVNFIQNFADVVSDASTGLGGFVENGVSVFIEGMLSLTDAAVFAFTAVEVGLENLESVGKWYLLKFLETSVSTFETVKWYLSEVLPAMIAWFGENWGNVLVDVTNFNSTVLENMYKNVLDFLSGISSLLQGGSFDFKFTALTEGFETTMDELPQIAERKIGLLERSLGSLANDVALDFGRKFNARLSENRNSFFSMFERDMSFMSEEVKSNADLNFDPSGFTQARKPKETSGSSGSSTGAFVELTALRDNIASAAMKKPEDMIVDAVEDFGDVMSDLPERVSEVVAPHSAEQVTAMSELVRLTGNSVELQQEMLVELKRQPTSVA